MLGVYYRFQITSLLSIASRLSGVFMTVITAPLAIIWLLALVLGQGPYLAMQGFLTHYPGKVLVWVSLLTLCYHLVNSIRHLVWDTGNGFEMSQIRATGWLAVVSSLVLAAAVWWGAS